MKQYEGAPKGRRLRIGLVVSRFNSEITERLLEGAQRALKDASVPGRAVTVVRVPGAIELPGGAQRLAASGSVDAVACLGAVIRGETEHFTFVSEAAQQGIMRVMLEESVPVTFGVLTTDTFEQAWERSGGSHGNKGYEAARDAVEMANLYRDLS